jgi:prepilin-type N-terminal cleavage/methylation domain-containing protein
MRERGFTLVEVMVAVAVTSILVVGVSMAAMGLSRSSERRQGAASREDRRSLALSLLHQDWRGRTRLLDPVDREVPGATVLAVDTTSDALGAESRSCSGIRWIASERGLEREERGALIRVLEGPVELEGWADGVWSRVIGEKTRAIRITVGTPSEQWILK